MTLSAVVAQAIALEAWRSAPRECCGFCTERQVFPSPNLHRKPEFHYLIEPRLWLRVPRHVAVYHSHPLGSGRPSRSDLEGGWEGLTYVIYSLEQRRLRAYLFRGERFHPLTLAIEP